MLYEYLKGKKYIKSVFLSYIKNIRVSRLLYGGAL